MKCPRCQFENREQIRFCEECGAKLEQACPSCGAAVPPDRKMITDCYNLSGDSSPRARVTISPVVLSLIMASYLVTKAPISQGIRLSRRAVL